MNLEVVRGRAARGGAEVSSISRFAESATGELGRAAELVQALLELARPVPVPVDLWSAIRPMVVLHQALATAGVAGAVGGDAENADPVPASVALEPRGDAIPGAAIDPAIARAALAWALDAATSARVPVRVSVSVGAREGGYVVVMLHSGGPAAPLEASVRGTLEEGGVRLDTVPDGLTLFFRAAARD